jgi:hypothetical protein
MLFIKAPPWNPMHNIPNKNVIGERLAKARHQAGREITQLDLAVKVTAMGVKIDRAGIAKIEVGLRHVLDYEVVALSKVLAVDIQWLLTGKKGRKS